MNIQFEKLFEVEILHNYYTSGISRDFEITPTARCRSQLRDYGMLFQKTGTGFVTLYEVVKDSAGNPCPRKPIEEDVKFSFMLQSKNPYLLNYSDLPLDNRSNQIYYLHNNQQQHPLLLTSDAKMSGGDRIELRPQCFQYHFDNFESVNPSAEIKICNELVNLKLKETVKSVEGTWNYLVDLRGCTPGKFKLHIDGEDALEFYADDEFIGKNIFGVIDVFRTDNVPSKYQVILEKRKTFWKYYVVLKYYLKKHPEITPEDLSEDLSINYPDPPPEFEQQPITLLSDKTPAIPFISNEELALQEESITGIKLVKNNGNNGGSLDLVENLPNPSVTTITPDASGTPDVSGTSEIFVYV